MRRYLLTLAAGLALGTPVLAAGARMPVYEPMTISFPGAYYLTRDVSGAGTPITIAADGVDLDLNGFAVRGDGTAAGILVASSANVRVRNGAVQRAGVSVTSSDAVWLEGLAIAGAPHDGISISSSSAVTVRDCDVVEPGTDGFGLFGAGPYLLVRNRVRGAGEDGITVSQIAGSIVEGTALSGGPGSQGRGLVNYGSNGVRYSGNRIVEGFIDGMAFFDSEGNRIAGNTVHGATGDGLLVFRPGYDNLVTANVLRVDDGGLTLFGDRSVLVGNVTNDGREGIEIFGDDNVIRRNVSRGNVDDFDISILSTGNVSAGDNFVPTRQ